MSDFNVYVNSLAEFGGAQTPTIPVAQFADAERAMKTRSAMKGPGFSGS